MLMATAQLASESGWRPVVDARRVPRELRNRWGLGAHISVGPLETRDFAPLPDLVARRTGLAFSRNMGIVLDASGFFLGDEWGPEQGEAAYQFPRWKRQRTPIVMLPQAFGPFSRKDVADAAKRVLDCASAIYARDSESLEHVRRLFPSDERLRLAPDFTAILSPPARAGYENSIVIVPNVNLLRRKDTTRASYTRSLARIAGWSADRGLDPVVLVHSRPDDASLAEEVATTEPRARVVVPRDGYEAKSILAGSCGVVAGRYHALASALSSGVPSVAHSWSHKYKALLADYSWDGALADPNDADAATEILSASLENEERRARLTAAAQRVKSASHEMWLSVGREFGGSSAR